MKYLSKKNLSFKIQFYLSIIEMALMEKLIFRIKLRKKKEKLLFMAKMDYSIMMDIMLRIIL